MNVNDDFWGIAAFLVLFFGMFIAVDWLDGPEHMAWRGEGIHYQDNRLMEERYRFKPRKDVTGWDTEKDWTLWDYRSRRVR